MTLVQHKCIECLFSRFPASGTKRRRGLLDCKKAKWVYPVDRVSFCTYWRPKIKKASVDPRSRKLLAVQMGVKTEIRRKKADKLHAIRDKIK